MIQEFILLVKACFRLLKKTLQYSVLDFIEILQDCLEWAKYPFLPSVYVIACVNKDKTVTYLCQSSLIGWSSHVSVAKRFKTEEESKVAVIESQTKYREYRDSFGSMMVVVRVPENPTKEMIDELETDLIYLYQCVG